MFTFPGPVSVTQQEKVAPFSDSTIRNQLWVMKSTINLQGFTPYIFNQIDGEYNRLVFDTTAQSFAPVSSVDAFSAEKLISVKEAKSLKKEALKAIKAAEKRRKT